MASFKFNIRLDQGADNEIDVNVTGLGINASSYTFHGAIRKHYDADTSVALGVRTVDAENIVLTMNAAVSANVDPGFYVYDIVAISPTNTTTRILEGMCRVKPSVYQA